MIIFDLEAVPRDDLTEQLILFRQSHIEMKSMDSRLKDPIKRAENLKRVQIHNDELIKNFRDRDGTDVDYAKIIAVGYKRDDKISIGTIEKMNEVQLLEKFSNILSEEKGPVVGYNIQGYDIPLLKRRCMYYGIEFPQVMRYRPIDIMWELCEWKRVKSKKLIEVAMALGMEINIEILNGKDIYPAYIEQNWAFIKTHLEQDLKMTEFVYNKLIQSHILDKPFKPDGTYIT